jgi:Tfp pilus assembly protein PilN
VKTATKQPSDPNAFAVLHQAGHVWRGIIARRGTNGRNGSDARPAIVACREFTADERAQVQPWIDQHHVSEVIGVLHASSVICRTFVLPNASDEQLTPALRLQAESHLLGIAPPHRMGMSVIEAAPGETSRIGLVLAWPHSTAERRNGDAPSSGSETGTATSLPIVDTRISFAPDIAGLAALLNGHRPAQSLLWADRADGSCAVAMTHANGAVFRGLREHEQDVEQWKESMCKAMAETALNVGHSSSFIEAMVRLTRERLSAIASGDARLFVPDEVIESATQRLENAPTDAAWWDQYGIAAGVILARCSKLADLTQLQEHEPQEQPSHLRTVIEFLSRPTTARYAVIACVLILFFGPLVMSSVRLGILKFQFNRVSDQLLEIQQTENKLIVYRQLSTDAWPMAKVLADIASCTPEGIELESINVRQQQTFTLSGRALPTGGRSAPQVVELMREQLRATGIFSDITLNWGQGDAYGNYEFGLNARLHRPFRKYEYPEEQDFARWTLAERRDGLQPGESRGAGDIPAPQRDVVQRQDSARDLEQERFADAGPSSDRRTITPSPVDRAAQPGGAASPRDDRAVAGARPSEIPPPLSEDEIRRMSQSEVSDTLVKISAARRIARRGDDQELIDRLQREFDLLMERMREAAEP